MRVSINVKIETPEEMTMTDLADYVGKALIDFSIKTKVNIEKSKITELKPKESLYDKD